MLIRMFGAAHVLLVGLQAIGAQAVVRGVNLGGWLVTEPWMNPSIFQATNTTDEWSLCAALGKQKCRETLEKHWSTYYTRDDLVQIKNAGLSIRIPLGYWAVDLLDYEPYVSGQYPYLVRAVQWARELSLTVFLDIHGAPGSQNGWEETGLVGPVNFLANATNGNRTLKVLKNLTSEFSQSSYGGVVTNIEPLNEPTLGFADLANFYTEAANVIGAGNSSGINVTVSDGFFNPHTWKNYNPWNPAALTPSPHLTIDTHQFWAFPPLDKLTKPEILAHICQFGQEQLRAPPAIGIPPVLVGEWSLSTGITANSTEDASKDQAKRTWFRTVFEAQNAAFAPNATGQSSVGWYFWSWKTEYDIDAWSYRKGLANQYIPSNVSDPSTYAFPIKDGCIDSTFSYTAPAFSSSSSSATPSATSNPTLQSGSVSPAKTGSAARGAPVIGTQAYLALGFVALVCIAV